jgi:rhodanese-related sulfurtransferase
MNKLATTLVTPRESRVRALPATEFAREVDRGESILVDVREADERVRDGSIRGAIHIPRGMLDFRADPSDALFDPRLDRRSPVLLFCTDGRRSALAVDTMVALGYSDVAHLDGGVHAWSEASLPLYGAQRAPY